MLTIYSKNDCSFCVQAKKLLERYSIEFNEIKVDEVPEAREFIMKQGHRTVPQIYKNGQLFVEGGYQGLSRLTESQIKEKIRMI
jgi:glutaredoxin